MQQQGEDVDDLCQVFTQKRQVCLCLGHYRGHLFGTAYRFRMLEPVGHHLQMPGQHPLPVVMASVLFIVMAELCAGQPADGQQGEQGGK